MTESLTPESVDANVLLRAALDLGDGQTVLARGLLASADRTFQVSLIVLAEFVHVLTTHYGLSRAQVSAVVDWVSGLESLDYPRDLVAAGLAAYRSHPKLSFEDCLLAEEAMAAGATPLWTFDAKLARQHPSARLVTAESVAAAETG